MNTSTQPAAKKEIWNLGGQTQRVLRDKCSAVFWERRQRSFFSKCFFSRQEQFGSLNKCTDTNIPTKSVAVRHRVGVSVGGPGGCPLSGFLGNSGCLPYSNSPDPENTEQQARHLGDVLEF